MLRKSFTLFLLIISTALVAQKGLHVGAQGTFKVPFIVNQNTYGFGEEFEYATTYGYAAGLEVGYHFIDQLGVFTGFQYTTQGQRYDDINQNQDEVNREVNLDYLRIPLYLRFSSPAEPVGFYVNAGAYYGILNNAAIDFTIAGQEVNNITDPEAAFEDGDWGTLVGLGAKIALAEQLYGTAGVRFTYSFNDINDEGYRFDNSDGLYEPSKNASIGVNVGVAYYFPLD